MFMYKMADWEGLETHMLAFQKIFLSICEDRTVNSLWKDFNRALHSGIEQYMFPCGLSVLSQHCHGSHKTLGGPCAKEIICSTNTNSTDALQTDKLIIKMLKDAHNRYIEEILDITDPIDHNDSNTNPKAYTDPHTNTFATKN